MGTIGTWGAQNCIFRIFRSDFNREMADIEGQSDSAGPLPHWLPWVCRILACLGGFWEFFGGFVGMRFGGLWILSGFLRVVPLVCLLIVVPDYSASHLVDSFVMWAAAGFAGYAAYLLHKNGDGPRLVISI